MKRMFITRLNGIAKQDPQLSVSTRLYRVILVIAMAALLLTGCVKQPEYFDPGQSVEIISAEDFESATPSQHPQPPLTVSGQVRSAQANGEIIEVSLLAEGLVLDIRINGDTTAVGDIFALDESSMITATVAEWRLDGEGYFGTAVSVSVDNDAYE